MENDKILIENIIYFDEMCLIEMYFTRDIIYPVMSIYSLKYFNCIVLRDRITTSTCYRICRKCPFYQYIQTTILFTIHYSLQQRVCIQR